MAAHYKSRFCWWPVRLARHADGRMEFIGWVWMQRAHLTKNLHHGWVCFLDSEPFNRCPKCGQKLPE